MQCFAVSIHDSGTPCITLFPERMSREVPLSPSKTAWGNSAYAIDPYLGIVNSQGADTRKTGDDPRNPSESAVASLLPRKSRKVTRPIQCQVDGCGRDLSSEKAYLQRYSVCDAHFKAEMSLVNSREMRFCQQCNKFQDLREFEGVRRSCMARSKDRNLRRRLQKGGTAEDGSMPFTAVATARPTQQRQQPQQSDDGVADRFTSGSPVRSGTRRVDRGVGNGSDGSRDYSGGASMGGSRDMARHAPGVGSGGSDYSLDAPGAAGLEAAWRGEGPGGALAVDVHSRQPIACRGPNVLPHDCQFQPQHHQAQQSGSGNGRGASSGNLDGSGQEALGVAARAWVSEEQMGQSYDRNERLAGSFAAASVRRGAGAGQLGAGLTAAAIDNSSMPMDMDSYGPAPSAPPHNTRHGHAGGPMAAVLSFDGGNARHHDVTFSGKMAAASNGDAAANASGCGGSARGAGARSFLANLDSRLQQRMPNAIPHSQAPRQQPQQQVAGPRGTHAVPGSTSTQFASWGSDVSLRLSMLPQEGFSGGFAGHQLTLGGSMDDTVPEELLEQIQGTDLGSRALLAAKEGWPPGGLVGQGLRGSGALTGLRRDQVDDSSSVIQVLQRQSQRLGSGPALALSQSHSGRDELSAMVKERRDALIRQQLMQQQHRHDVLIQQEQLQRLGSSTSNGGYLQTEPLQPVRYIGQGARAGNETSGVLAAGVSDNYLKAGPVFRARGGGGGQGALEVDSGLGADAGGAGRLFDARRGHHFAIGGVPSLVAGEGADLVRRQTPTDISAFDAAQLLEHYALGGGSIGLGRFRGNGGVGEHEGTGQEDGGRSRHRHGEPIGPSATNGDVCAGNGEHGRFSKQGSDDMVGIAGGNGTQWWSNGGDGKNGGLGGGTANGNSRLLSMLLPITSGREDALAARVCLKLFSCTPPNLPEDMLARLQRWAAAAEPDVLQIFMRPGCVHLIINMRLSKGSRAVLDNCVLGGGDLHVAVEALRSAFQSSGLLTGRRVVVQAAERPRGAFEYDGTAGGQARWVADADLERAPSVVAVQPAALLCDVSTVLTLKGRNLRRPGTRFYARCSGRSYELQSLVAQPDATQGGNGKGGSDALPAVAAEEESLPQVDKLSSDEPCTRAGSMSGSKSFSSSPSPLINASRCLGDASVCAESPPQLGNSHGTAGSWMQTRFTGDQTVMSSASEGMRADNQLQQQASSAISAELLGPSPPERLSALSGKVACLAGSDLEVVWVLVPALPHHGLVAVEAIACDMDVMGSWAPAVVCQDPLAAAELNVWLRQQGGAACGSWLLKELGVLLDYDKEFLSRLHRPMGVAAGMPWESGVGEAAGATRHDEGSVALAPSARSGAAARSTATSTFRGGHQRALKHQQQLRGVAAAVSNPLPRSSTDTSGMFGMARAGALSAVPYAHANVSSSVTPGLDGSMVFRAPRVDSASATEEPQHHATVRHEAPAPMQAATMSSVRVLMTRSVSGASASGVPWSCANLDSQAADGWAMLQPFTGRPAILSDDTKVSDAPGRLLDPALRRLLSHPLLHSSCRRAMQFAGARLLSFSVASGLRLLANGLMEWLVFLEMAQVTQLGSGSGSAIALPASGVDSQRVKQLADVFGRVRARAAIATVFGATSAGMSGGRIASRSGHSSELHDNSSCGRSTGSLRSDPIRKLGSGLGLLHLAVGSCSSAMLLQVLDWAEQYGCAWTLEEQAWPGRATALHLAAGAAALRSDGGEAARLLLSLGPEVQDAWLQVRDSEGRTPADIARAAGLHGLNYFAMYGEEEAPLAAEAQTVSAKPPAMVVSSTAVAGLMATDSGDAKKGRYGDLGQVIAGEVLVSSFLSGQCSSACEGVVAGSLGAGQGLHTLLPPPRHPAALGMPLLLGALLGLLVAATLRILEH